MSESYKYLQSLDSIKVLIADDDESMRNLLRSAISQWGFQVLEAAK